MAVDLTMEEPVNSSQQNGINREKSHLFLGWKKVAKSKVKRACTVKLLRRRLPIIDWLPTYNLKFAINDFIAGLTVSLITIPQGIAYAAVAGLPLQVTMFIQLLYHPYHPRSVLYTPVE